MIQQSRQPKVGHTISSTVKYELRDDPFIIPVKFKRQLPINKNFFELQEAEPKNYQKSDKIPQMTEMTLLDPLQMAIATIKFLLAQTIISYASLFSITISIFEVYYVSEGQQQLKQSFNYLHVAITALIAICELVSAVFHFQNNRTRRIDNRTLILETLLKEMIIIFSPNPWWEAHSKLLHLILLARLFFPATVYIRSTLYYSPRAARIINLYGLKPEMTFEFAWKVILNNMNLFQVLLAYASVVVFYSHCLFLASQGIPFLDCFEIIIVTLPTVGFGEYQIGQIIPRGVILLVLLTGVALNAFVTLTLLKQFQMTSNENNSYILMQKLIMVQKIEELSSEFIIRKFSMRGLNQSRQRQKDDDFKERYHQCKSRYRKMNLQDSSYQFTYFKDSLLDLKIKIYQANNMVNVLLAKLANHRRDHKAYSKLLKKQQN